MRRGQHHNQGLAEGKEQGVADAQLQKALQAHLLPRMPQCQSCEGDMASAKARLIGAFRLGGKLKYSITDFHGPVCRACITDIAKQREWHMAKSTAPSNCTSSSVCASKLATDARWHIACNLLRAPQI